jgi:hypothetical protein
VSLMAELIISTLVGSLFAATIVFFLSVIAKMLKEEGVECHTCLDTGIEVGSVSGVRCKHGCAENHDSPYWDLAAVKQ